jgi:CheY-like chemotaxis protein
VAEPFRIVLVDDDDAIEQLLRVNFELDPRFELVARCRDGSDALEAVRRHTPDAVLMDLNMPSVGGVEATRILLEADPDACVIAFTATDDPRELEAVRAAGAVGVLRKPFDPVAFLDAVADHAADCAAA